MLCPGFGKIARRRRETNVPVDHPASFASGSDSSPRRMGRGWRGPRPARGRSLVKAANWLTHLEYEWDSPVWKHWLQFFSSHFRFVRYDERGCGMSDWSAGALSVDQWSLGSRGGDRRRATRRSDGAARHLAGLRRRASSTRSGIRNAGRADDSVWRLRARRAAARHAAEPRRIPGDGRPGAGLLGKGQPGIPAGLHLALHSRRQPGAAAVVQRSLPQDHDRARSRPSLFQARAAVDISDAARAGAHADAGAARARGRGGRRSRKGASWRAEFPVPSSSSSTRATTCCSSTSRRGSGSVKRCSRSCSRAPARGIRSSRHCRRVSVRCWR